MKFYAVFRHGTGVYLAYKFGSQARKDAEGYISRRGGKLIEIEAKTIDEFFGKVAGIINENIKKPIKELLSEQ